MKHARIGAALASTALGLGLLAAPALADDDTHREVVCHQEGNGSFHAVPPAQASAHLGKHGHDFALDAAYDPEVDGKWGDVKDRFDALCNEGEPEPEPTETATVPAPTETTTATTEPEPTETTTTEAPNPTSSTTTSKPTETTTSPEPTETTTTPEPTETTTEPEPTEPSRPDPHVYVYEEDLVDCEAMVLTHYTATFTTPYVLEDGEWVLAPEPSSIDEDWTYSTPTAEQCPVAERPEPTETTQAPVAVVKPRSTPSASAAPQSPSVAPQQAVLANTGFYAGPVALAGLMFVAIGVGLSRGARVRVERKH